MIDGNPGIQRFVWEHLVDMVQILQRIKAVGGTVSAKKLQICVPRGIIVGHECTYAGQVPEESKVQKIKDWPDYCSVTEVCKFIRTVSVICPFIWGFAQLA